MRAKIEQSEPPQRLHKAGSWYEVLAAMWVGDSFVTDCPHLNSSIATYCRLHAPDRRYRVQGCLRNEAGKLIRWTVSRIA